MKLTEPTKYTYHQLKENYETTVKEFCSRLWGWRKHIRIQALEKAEFKKFDRKNTTDAFVSYLKEKHEVLGIEEDVHVIRLLDSGKGFHVESLIHELLHVYRPQDSEKEVKQTEQWLFWGFQIWEKLYDSEPLREYFMELFRKDFLRPKEKEIWDDTDNQS